MLSKDQIERLKVDIEWAQLAVDKGSVYHVKWAQKYVDDVRLLLEQIVPDFGKKEIEARAEEVLSESKKG